MPHGDDRARRSRRRPDQREPQRHPRAPALETTARKIAQADEVIYSATATDTREINVYKGNYVVVVAPHLAASFTGAPDAYWYMLDTTDPGDRGLIFQEREPVRLVTLFDLADASVFQRDEYVWGTRARYTAAAGNPKKIFRHRLIDGLRHPHRPHHARPSSAALGSISTTAQDAAPRRRQRDGRLYLRTRYSTPVGGTASTTRAVCSSPRGTSSPCAGTTRSAAGTGVATARRGCAALAARRVLGQGRAFSGITEASRRAGPVHRRHVRRVAGW